MSNKEKVIHITIPKDYKPKKVNGKKCTGLFPIYDEVCDPRIDSPEYVKMIYNSEKSIEKIAEESTSSVEEIKSLLKEYDNALELRMEQFKDKIGKTKKFFLEIEEGLKSLITQMPNIEGSESTNLKSYCEVFDGEKWVDTPKKLGKNSFIIQKDNRETKMRKKVM